MWRKGILLCIASLCAVICLCGPAMGAEGKAKIYLSRKSVTVVPGKPTNFTVVIENPSQTLTVPAGMAEIVPPKGWKVNQTKIGTPKIRPLESMRPFFSLGVPPSTPAGTYKIPVTVRVGKQKCKFTMKIVMPAKK